MSGINFKSSAHWSGVNLANDFIISHKKKWTRQCFARISQQQSVVMDFEAPSRWSLIPGYVGFDHNLYKDWKLKDPCWTEHNQDPWFDHEGQRVNMLPALFHIFYLWKPSYTNYWLWQKISKYFTLHLRGNIKFATI